MRFTGAGTIRLNSGREMNTDQLLLAVNFNGKQMPENAPYDGRALDFVPLTTEERIEIADEMVDYWNRWSAGVLEKVSPTPLQLALYEHMSYLSGEHWCAGWMDRLGETLQGIIDRDNHHPAGYVAFTVEEFEKLKHLHAEAGGWWVWDDAVVDGPEGDCVRFVPDVAK